MTPTTVPEALRHELFQQRDYAGAVALYRKALSASNEVGASHHQQSPQ